MKLLIYLRKSLRTFAKSLRNIPKALTIGLQGTQMQAERDTQETERLDRLRNPSKYQGR